jgi:hypothetical protein
MSYCMLHLPVRGLISALLVLLLPAAFGQDEHLPVVPEVEPVELVADAGLVEPTTNTVCQLGEPNLAQESIAPVVKYEPPPPQVIQVQLPSIPVLSREDIELLIGRLYAIEQRLIEQQTNTTAMVIRSNQSILTVGAILGGMGLLGIVGAGIVLMRAFNRFSDVMLTLPMGQQLGRGVAFNALAIDEVQSPPSAALEQVSARFLWALEQLEKRVRELEVDPLGMSASATPASPGNGNPKIDIISTSPSTTSGLGPEGSPSTVESISNPEKENDNVRRIQKLFEEGEAFLQSERYEDALSRFDEALTIDPRNAEALIKRGLTLERLQRMEAALESYDRAIATNGSLTLAYLHKGAICNRLQRYREALECYERALQSEQKF